MDDKVVTPATETVEYKYTDAEASPAEAAASVDEANPETGANQATLSMGKFNFKNIDWRRFMRPLIILVTIVVVYLGYSFFSNKKIKGLEQQKIAMQENAALVQQQQQAAMVNTDQPIRASLPSTPVSSPDVSSEQQAQNTAREGFENVVKQLASGQEAITSMKNIIDKNERDVADINQKIEQLTVLTQQLAEDIEKIKLSLPPVKKKVAKLPVAYHIRAIVPGRAWLDSADGRSVTLRVGDKLEGYGEVKTIAPRQGMVVMSNGSIIQYGVGDF